MANLETPEQVREKMAQRLFELKQKREEERQEEVNRRLEQRFRDSKYLNLVTFYVAADDLRKEESKFTIQHVQLEREKQLMDKQRRTQQQIMEEQIYAKLWELDLKKKAEREKIEAEEKKKLVGDTMAFLNCQKETRQLTKQQEKDLTEMEKQMLKQQWQKEEEYERELQRQQFVLNRERNLELIRHNEAEKQLRGEQSKFEKERDREMLNNALTKEQMIERAEQEEKLRRRQEVIDLQKYYLQKAEDKRAEEQLIEHLTWLESEKQWKMREDKWRKEEQARINLMKNVYDARLQTVELKKKVKEEENWLLNNEKKVLETELERQAREAEERKI